MKTRPDNRSSTPLITTARQTSAEAASTAPVGELPSLGQLFCLAPENLKGMKSISFVAPLDWECQSRKSNDPWACPQGVSSMCRYYEDARTTSRRTDAPFGGSYFDERERVAINSEVNAEVIATLATWVTGPGRIAVDAQEFTASGNRLKLEGFVVASIMPDWLGGVWKQDMGDLAGKVKLMPVPAWKEGGCRTTVWGGTMLGIARSTKDPEAAWEMAKHLYLSEDLAEPRDDLEDKALRRAQEVLAVPHCTS